MVSHGLRVSLNVQTPWGFDSQAANIALGQVSFSKRNERHEEQCERGLPCDSGVHG